MKVAVFGLGYVGTVTAACLAANGHEVWGVDVDKNKVEAIRSRAEPRCRTGSHRACRARPAVRAVCTPRCRVEQAIEDADVSLSASARPRPRRGAPTSIYSACRRRCDDCLAARKAGQPRFHSVVVRSTVPPGTVEGIGEKLSADLADSGQTAGVAMCPEFLRKGPASRISIRRPTRSSALRPLCRRVVSAPLLLHRAASCTSSTSARRRP